MRRLKVVYSNEDKSTIDIDMELDKMIQAFFESQGFWLTGQGVDLTTEERDISFMEAKKGTEPF